MSDLDYDALRKSVVTATIRGRCVLVTPLELTRLLDLAQRAEADRAAIERVRALADEAQPAISHGPADCKNTCWDGACTCSGIPRPLGWTLDPEAIRAALDPKEDQ